jgi:flagellar motor switch protein FliM
VPRRQATTTTSGADGTSTTSRRARRGTSSLKAAPVVKPWDFRSQEGLDRLAMAAVRQMAEAVCRIVGSRISTWARAKVTVRLEKVEQLDWQTFQSQVGELATFGAFNLAGSAALVCIPASLAMAVIELLLGGTGKGSWPRRQLTDLEQQLVAPVFTSVSEAVAEAASSVFGRVEAGQVAQVGSNPSVLLASRQRQVICFEGAVDLGANWPSPGSVVICLPVDTLRPLFAHLGRSRPPKEQSYGLAERAAGSVPLRLSLCYPPVAVPVSVAQRLAPGQVVGLGHPIGEPLLLKVGAKAVFLAVPVEHGKRAACKVVRRTEQLKLGGTNHS